jgi:hypothetical protein
MAHSVPVEVSKGRDLQDGPHVAVGSDVVSPLRASAALFLLLAACGTTSVEEGAATEDALLGRTIYDCAAEDGCRWQDASQLGYCVTAVTVNDPRFGKTSITVARRSTSVGALAPETIRADTFSATETTFRGEWKDGDGNIEAEVGPPPPRFDGSFTITEAGRAFSLDTRCTRLPFPDSHPATFTCTPTERCRFVADLGYCVPHVTIAETALGSGSARITIERASTAAAALPALAMAADRFSADVNTLFAESPTATLRARFVPPSASEARAYRGEITLGEDFPVTLVCQKRS